MLPVILNLKGKTVVVFGGGKVAERRILKFLDAGARVTAISKEFTGKIDKFDNQNLKRIKKEVDLKNAAGYVDMADVVAIATNDENLNNGIEILSKTLGKPVNRADAVSDFIIPATLKIGDVMIAISTTGKSPAVAKILKNRIKKVVTPEDVLLIELEEFAREKLKGKIRNQEERKRILREIINRPDITICLKKGDIKRAKEILEL
jgi:precorrin-2 dehydrogenase